MNGRTHTSIREFETKKSRRYRVWRTVIQIIHM